MTISSHTISQVFSSENGEIISHGGQSHLSTISLKKFHMFKIVELEKKIYTKTNY